MSAIEKFEDHLFNRPAILERSRDNAVKEHGQVRRQMSAPNRDIIPIEEAVNHKQPAIVTLFEQKLLEQKLWELQLGVQIENHVLETRTGVQTLLTLKLDCWHEDAGITAITERCIPAEKARIETAEKRRIIEHAVVRPFVLELHRSDMRSVARLQAEAYGWANDFPPSIKQLIVKYVMEHLANIMQIRKEHRQ